MSGLGIMKAVARTEMLDLGEMSDGQLRKVNEICQAFYDVGLADGKKEVEHWKNNHADMVKRNAELRDRPDLGDRCKSIDNLYAERDRLFALCKIVFYPTAAQYPYPIEHNPYANKDMKSAILSAIKEKRCS